MKKFISILVITLSLVGCGEIERAGAKLTGYSEICVKGVTYYQFTSGSTVGYSADGKVLTCK